MRYKIEIKKREKEAEPRMTCPACGSWDKNTKEEYEVEYKGLRGKCLNPICKAEWRIKMPQDKNGWQS